MKDNIFKNASAKKILLIAWLVVCTALLVYFVVIFISSINTYLEILKQYQNPMYIENVVENLGQAFVDEQIQAVNLGIFYTCLTFVCEILLYVSFTLLLIPKIIAIVRHSC